jgi:hypothetical protein
MAANVQEGAGMKLRMRSGYALVAILASLWTTGCAGSGARTAAADRPSVNPTNGYSQIKDQLQPFDPHEVWAYSDRSPTASKSAAKPSPEPAQTASVSPQINKPAAPAYDAKPALPATTAQTADAPPPPPPLRVSPPQALPQKVVAAAAPAPSTLLQTLDAETVQRIGEQLSITSACRDARFSFGTITNKRPQVERTGQGQIVVSTGLLKELHTDEELAAILALQMADVVSLARSRKTTAMPVSQQLPGAGYADAARDAALAEKIARDKAAPEVDDVASEILRQAGYSRVAVADARDRIKRWDAAAPALTRIKNAMFAN